MTSEITIDKNKTKCLIGGKWEDAVSGETIAVEDPSNEEIIAHIPRGGKEDIEKAVVVARKAFESPAWSNMRPLDRGRILETIALKVEEHADEFAMLESIDNGMPVAHAKMLNIPATIDVFRYMAGWCSKNSGSTFPVSFDGRQYHAYTRRQPVGVVGAITPWNYPLGIGAWKIASALAAGCTMVMKPSEMTSLSTLRLAELAHEAGLPEGVLNVVTGYGHEAGMELAQHKDVNKITFTGSTRVGKKIVEYSLDNMKRVTLELGGKSPSIVFADADLDEVGPAAALAVFFNSGQICFAATRLLVQESVYDKVVESISAVAQSFKIGNGRDPETVLGPLISQKQRDAVLAYCASGIEQGAELVTGGNARGDKGYFMEPTVFANTNPSMKIVQEEIFGPVVSVMPFKDEEEALKLANDSSYGLAANVWTRDIKRAHTMANRLEAGSVWLNCHGVLDSSLPFGGFKQSGWGREVSEEGLQAYTETKTVCALLD